MPWFRVDDQFHSHPKAEAAGNAALGLWVLLGSWAAERQQGEIPMRVALTYGTRAQINKLIDAGLLDQVDANVELHDWDHWQGPLTSADRARAYRRRQASRKVTNPRDETRDDRETERPSPSPDLTIYDDDEVVHTPAAVTKRDGQPSPRRSSSSSKSLDVLIAVAAHALGEQKQNTTSSYVRGIARNLVTERGDELDRALVTTGDPIAAAGIIVGSPVAARLAARALGIENDTTGERETTRQANTNGDVP